MLEAVTFIRFSGSSFCFLFIRFEVIYFSGDSSRSLLLQFEVVRFSDSSSHSLLIRFKAHFSGSSWCFEVVIFNSISEKKTKILLELKYHHSSIFTLFLFGNLAMLQHYDTMFLPFLELLQYFASLLVKK